MELSKESKKRERITWRLSPANYDFLNEERIRLGLTSMNAALNVVLTEYRVRRRQSGGRVTVH